MGVSADKNPLHVPDGYYVYVHLKADSKVPFYVGKGSGFRAYSKNRSEWWQRCAQKHGWVVEFLHTGLSEAEALNLEIEEIAWFRRQGYKMVNVSDGGDGCTQRERTEEKKNQIRAFIAQNGRYPSASRPEERRLYVWLANYCSTRISTYSPEFRTEMEALGYAVSDVENKKQAIRDFSMTHGRFPSGYKSEERYLCVWLENYCRIGYSGSSPEFRAEMEALGYAVSDVENKKQAIRDFRMTHGRFPKRNNQGEEKMRAWLANYCSPAHDCYCPEFRAEMEALGYAACDVENKKQAIRDFWKSHGRLPSANNPDERFLRSALIRYCVATSKSYNAEFRAEMAALGYAVNPVAGKIQEIRDFTQRHGRLPDKNNQEELVLWRTLVRYCTPSDDSFCPELRTEMQALGYGARKPRTLPQVPTKSTDKVSKED